MNATGAPGARAASVPPEPPWPTIAAACGMTVAWSIQRSTWTFACSGPSAARSRGRPVGTRRGFAVAPARHQRPLGDVRRRVRGGAEQVWRADLRAEADVGQRGIDPGG